ncbi:MAG: DUF58 domain-containing protein [Chloroflexota bacterium]|nr:DUF58 domain-containing protein [Chloroflexota bacterium]
MPLFDDAARRKLEQVTLVASRARAGAIKGERRSSKRGTSIEFADYRDYVPGDDLRRLDWNVYARLDRPLTKLYEDEEDLAVHLLLDASASMDYPAPDADSSPTPAGEGSGQAVVPVSKGSREGVASKFDMARRLIAGLGVIALTANDRLTITVLGGRGESFGPVRGRGAAARLLAFIESVRPGGAVDLDAALKGYAGRAARPGLCVLISDLMVPSGIRDGLNALVGRGYQVGVVHVLAPTEIDPTLNGDLRLVDSETGAAQEVTLDDSLRDLYKRRLASWRDGLAADCRQRGAAFVPTVSDAPWEKIILSDLRRAGLVK